jgi:hypothetical protein
MNAEAWIALTSLILTILVGLVGWLLRMERRHNGHDRVQAEHARRILELETGHREFKSQAYEDRRVLQTITMNLATLTERIDQGFKYLGNEISDLKRATRRD